MPIFNGTLAANKVFATQFNQKISEQVFPTGVSDLDGLYASRKVDGTMFGDYKTYTATDALASYEFDGTDTPGSYNLLTVKRPPAPKTYVIRMGEYRQIPVTIDSYFTKQMWMGPDAFNDFNGVILGWLQKTKDVYEHTKFNTDLILSGMASAKALGTIALAAPSGISGYDLLKWRGQELFRVLDDMVSELSEPSRDYNDAGFLRNYTSEDFDIVIPKGIMSSVSKHDIPFLFEKDSKLSVKEVHWKYFGALNAASGTTSASNTTIRAFVEGDWGSKHLFPGDLLPNSTAYDANTTYTATYTARPSINTAFNILLMHKQDYPIMSAFADGSSFANARRLDSNHYLTFGHNPVYDAHIGEYALLKIAVTVA